MLDNNIEDDKYYFVGYDFDATPNNLWSEKLYDVFPTIKYYKGFNCLNNKKTLELYNKYLKDEDCILIKNKYDQYQIFHLSYLKEFENIIFKEDEYNIVKYFYVVKNITTTKDVILMKLHKNIDGYYFNYDEDYKMPLELFKQKHIVDTIEEVYELFEKEKKKRIESLYKQIERVEKHKFEFKFIKDNE